MAWRHWPTDRKAMFAIDLIAPAILIPVAVMAWLAD